MSPFDPNSAATKDSGIFGLPHGREALKAASVVYIPVPWEVTTSYGGGTSRGPEAILNASRQVDLFLKDAGRPYEAGLYMLKPSLEVIRWNQLGKKLAKPVIDAAGVGQNKKLKKAAQSVNELSEKLNQWVRNETLRFIRDKKTPVIIGGDHSVPYGAIEVYADYYGKKGEFGILHLDAHLDTRCAFEGFKWSHASIFYNVLENIPQVSKLVQVGIRDFCEEEFKYCQAQGKRVKVFFDKELKSKEFEGVSWATQAEQIVSTLPQNVYISFDIDALDPVFCPHTGTPVPGGLSFSQAIYLAEKVVQAKKTIVGFDLNEVAPDPYKKSEWDANVGARLLYQLTALMLLSQKQTKF